MKALHKRLDALEVTEKPQLSPGAKQWLGLPLTPDEEAQLAADAGVETDWDAIDTSDWSQELKTWLGVD